MISYNSNISKKTTILMRITCFASDIIAFIAIYFLINNQLPENLSFEINFVSRFMLVFIIIFMLVGGYSRNNLFSVSRNFKLITVTTISMPFTFNLFLYIFDTTTINSSEFIYLLYYTFFLIFSLRFIVLIFLRYSKILDSTILIIGDGRKEDLFNEYDYINVESLKTNVEIEEDPYFLNAISKSVKFVDRVILDFKNIKEADKYANLVSSTSNNIEIIRRMSRLPVSSINNFDGYQTLKLKTYGSDFKQMTVKRIFDICLVILSMPLWVPLILICSIIIRIDSPGPIFFRQKRIGLRNEFFEIYKFRTMFNEFTDPNGSKLTEKNDSRVTRFGSFLRKSSLDELPQLINVLKLEMSLVGPRPSTLEAKAGGKNYWDKFPDYWKRHMILPGMTGLAQIRGLRGNTFTKNDLLLRYKSDIEYLNNWSILLDIKIIFLTIFSLFSEESF